MLWEGINVKPLVTILLFKLFDKTGNFTVSKKSDKVCIEVNRLRYLCIEIYKSINNMKQTEQFDTCTN